MLIASDEVVVGLLGLYLQKLVSAEVLLALSHAKAVKHRKHRPTCRLDIIVTCMSD